MAENTVGAIRSGILGSKKGKTKIVDMFGHNVEVRQPTVGQLLDLESNEDRKSALVNMLVTYCYMPKSDQRIFTKEDASELMALPAGEWLSGFNDAIAELTNVDVAEAEKNLEATA